MWNFGLKLGFIGRSFFKLPVTNYYGIFTFYRLHSNADLPNTLHISNFCRLHTSESFK